MPPTSNTAASTTTASAAPSTADLRSLSRLLDKALRVPAAQAETWLATLPAATRHLAPRLRSLLQQHRTGACAGFLAGSPRLNDDSTASSIQRGHLAGPYRLLREIGRGGMCSVWLAEPAEPGTGRRGTGRGSAGQVAIKLPHRAVDADTARRLAHERDITALMRHPQLARLRGAGLDAAQRPYLVLDHVAGQRLDHWCKRTPSGRPASLPARLRLAVQLARALAHVHGLGVVHRDLKPANVLVSARGKVHLVDFGIACRLAPGSPCLGASSTELSFTPAYAAPEQLRGEPGSCASDIYALGVLVFELLTGQLPQQPPASCRGWLAARDAERRDGAPRLASSRVADPATAAQLRGAVDAVLCRALAPRPAQRHASAGALADALQACLGLQQPPRRAAPTPQN